MRKHLLQRDVLSGLLLIIFSVLLWTETTTFPQLNDGYPGPSLFPQIIALLLGLVGTYLAIKSILNRKPRNVSGPYRPPVGKIIRLITGVLLVSTYPFLVHHVHFIPIMAGLILCFGIILKNKPWQAMLTAVLSAGIIYALFTQLLGVPL